LRSYTNSLTAYLFIGFLLLFVGMGALFYNINAALANFEYVLAYILIGMVVFIPILTMKVISEEKKLKTDMLLYSLPLSDTKIIVGKYLALVTIFLIPCVIIGFYPLIFKSFGDVYLLTSYGSLLAFFIMGMALIAIGMFVSSLSENMGFALSITIVLLLFNYYSVTLAEYVSSSSIMTLIFMVVMIILIGFLVHYVTKDFNISIIVGFGLFIGICLLFVFKYEAFEGILPSIMETLSLFNRFYTFVNGVFDLTSIVFYLSVAVFFVFLTVQSFSKRRYN
ncbi:MAG: ABC transporter permease, partial [Erysipelotrichaceae bacterium]